MVDKGTYFGMESSKADLRLPKTFKNSKQLAGESWNHTVGSNDVLAERIYLGDQIDSVPIYGLIYREAYNGVDVIYKPLWKGIHEEYVIKTPASQHSFQVDYPQASSIRIKQGRKEIAMGRVSVKDFYVVNKDGKRIREPHNLLGPTNDFEPIITETPAKFVVTVPVQNASDYPITLDPSPFDSDADNAAFFDVMQTKDDANGTAWATLHNAVDGTSVTINPADSTIDYGINMYADANGHELIRRFAFQIDTDSIGSGSTISSSTFKRNVISSAASCSVGNTANDAMGYILVNSKQSTLFKKGIS